VIELDVVLNKLEEHSRSIDYSLRQRVVPGSDVGYSIGYLQGQSAGIQSAIDIIKRALDDEYAKEVEL
jgi:hypothetical protein